MHRSLPQSISIRLYEFKGSSLKGQIINIVVERLTHNVGEQVIHADAYR